METLTYWLEPTNYLTAAQLGMVIQHLVAFLVALMIFVKVVAPMLFGKGSATKALKEADDIEKDNIALQTELRTTHKYALRLQASTPANTQTEPATRNPDGADQNISG